MLVYDEMAKSQLNEIVRAMLSYSENKDRVKLGEDQEFTYNEEGK